MLPLLTRTSYTHTWQVHVGDKWHRCDPAGGAMIVLQPYQDGNSGTVTCPPAAELCDLDTELWPVRLTWLDLT